MKPEVSRAAEDKGSSAFLLSQITQKEGGKRMKKAINRMEEKNLMKKEVKKMKRIGLITLLLVCFPLVSLAQAYAPTASNENNMIPVTYGYTIQTYNYSDNGTLLNVTDNYGNVTTYQYGRRIDQKDNTGNILFTFTYENGVLVGMKDQYWPGYETIYEHGRVKYVTSREQLDTGDWVQRTTLYTYNSDGSLNYTREYEGKGKEDENGRLTGYGRPLKETTYVNGRQTETRSMLPGDNNALLTKYNYMGSVLLNTQTFDETGNILDTTYYTAGKVTHITNKEGAITQRYRYDNKGRREKVEIIVGGQVTLTTYFDDKGRQWKTIDDAGKMVRQWFYNGAKIARVEYYAPSWRDLDNPDPEMRREKWYKYQEDFYNAEGLITEKKGYNDPREGNIDPLFSGTIRLIDGIYYLEATDGTTYQLLQSGAGSHEQPSAFVQGGWFSSGSITTAAGDVTDSVGRGSLYAFLQGNVGKSVSLFGNASPEGNYLYVLGQAE